MLLLLKSSIMKSYLTITFLILLYSCGKITGQIIEENDAMTGQLSLRIKNINFVKDNEYFNNISASDFKLVSSLPLFVDKSLWIEGYTLPGFFFQPELVYTPSSRLTVRGGLHLLKYAGMDKFAQIKPVISTTLKLTEHTSVTVGSLSGSDRHRFFDPVFNSERLYTDYSEDGFQATTLKDHIFNDNWLSWEKFVRKGDREREIFAVGESFNYTSPVVQDILQFEVPVQVQFKHFGGQISNFPDHVETYFNLATGIRVNLDPANLRYGKAGIEYLQFFNSEFPRKPPSGITHGYASWYRFHYNYKIFYFGLYYWKSHNFFSPNGNPIYGSVIDIRSEYVIPDRKVITNSIYLTFLPESYIELFLGIDSYYDVCLKRMDNSFMIHLNFDRLFRLATFKN
jgi:hypothetical protein